MGYITFVAKHDGLTNVSGRLVGKQEGDKEEKEKHSLSTSMVLIYLATVLYNTSIYAQSSQQQDLEGSNDHRLLCNFHIPATLQSDSIYGIPLYSTGIPFATWSINQFINE